MKKIFLLLLVIYCLFFSRAVIAQTTNNLNFSVPGWTCGVAEDPQKNKCCQVNYPSKFIPPDLGPLNVITNMFTFLIDMPKKLFIQPLIDIMKNNYKSCYTGIPSTDKLDDPNCQCINPITPQPEYIGALDQFCQRQSKPEERIKCLNCANGGGVWSGMGCVYTDTKDFIEKTVFGLGIGFAGGFALLCIIYAAFMMQSSQGNPEKLKKAQELITSCIMGLMLIIFSVFILRLIGVNILKIPGFS